MNIIWNLTQWPHAVESDGSRAALLRQPVTPLKFPDTILVSSASSDLFDGSEAAPNVDQFVAPGNREDRIRRPGTVLGHESVSLPIQTGNFILAKGDSGPSVKSSNEYSRTVLPSATNFAQ